MHRGRKQAVALHSKSYGSPGSSIRPNTGRRSGKWLSNEAKSRCQGSLLRSSTWSAPQCRSRASVLARAPAFSASRARRAHDNVKVNWHSPLVRRLIACPSHLSMLRKPTAKTRLRERPPEPRQRSSQGRFSAVRIFRKSRKLPRFRQVSSRINAAFSALQTAWRRGGDSNPR